MENTKQGQMDALLHEELQDPGRYSDSLVRKIEALLGATPSASGRGLQGESGTLNARRGRGGGTGGASRPRAAAAAVAAATTSRAGAPPAPSLDAAERAALAVKILGTLVQAVQTASQQAKEPQLAAAASAPARTRRPTHASRRAAPAAPAPNTNTNADGAESMRNRFFDAVLIIARAAFMAMEAVETPWTRSSLQLEKLACNIATRLLDCRALDHAFEVARFALARLGVAHSNLKKSAAPTAAVLARCGRSTTAKAASASTKGPSQTTPDLSLQLPHLQRTSGQYDRAALALKCISDCPIDDRSSSSMLHVTSTLLMSILRWLLASSNTVNVEHAVLAKTGLAGLCEKMCSAYPKLGSAQCGNIFRILYTHMDLIVLPSGAHLVYYYMRSPGFSPKGLHALIQQPAIAIDKSLKMDPSDAILGYYRSVAEIDGVLDAFDMDCLSWIEHALTLCRKASHPSRHEAFWMTASDRALDQITVQHLEYEHVACIIKTCRHLTSSVADGTCSNNEHLIHPKSSYANVQIGDIPRRLQASLLASVGTLKDALEFDLSPLDQDGDNSKYSLLAQTARVTVNAIACVVPALLPVVDKMDGDLVGRLTKLVFSMMLMRALHIAVVSAVGNVPDALNSSSQVVSLPHHSIGEDDIQTQLMWASEYARQRMLDPLMEQLSSCAYRAGTLLLRHNGPAASMPLLLLSTEWQKVDPTAQPTADTSSTTLSAETRIHHARRLDLLSYCQQELGHIDAALESASSALVTFPVSTRLQPSSKANAVFERLLGRYVSLSLSSERDYQSVLTILPHNEIEDASIAGHVLNLETQLLKGAGADGQARLASLTQAERFHERTGNALLQARALLDRARALRTSIPENHADIVHCCNQAIAVLKPLLLHVGGKAQAQIHAQAQHELAIAHCELGIALNASGAFEVRPFHMAMSIWRRLLANVPSFTLPMRKTEAPPTSSQPEEMERVFKFIDMLCDYFHLLGQPINALYALRLLFKVVQLCPSKTITDVLALYREMASTYLDLGCTGKSGIMFSLGKQLADSRNCDRDDRRVFMCRFARYLASVSNVDKGQAVLDADADPFADLHVGSLRDGERVFMRVRACLDKSHLSFARCQPELAAAEACAAYALVARLSKRVEARIAAGKPVVTPSAKSGHFASLLGIALMDCCIWLGSVYDFLGAFVEAEAYLTKGLDAARAACSDGRVVAFSAALASLKARRAQHDEATALVQTATAHAHMAAGQLPATAVAAALAAEGDIQISSGLLQKAVALYENASTELTRAAEEKLVARLEDLPIDVDNLTAPQRTNSRDMALVDSRKDTRQTNSHATTTKKSASAPPPTTSTVAFTPLAKVKIKGRSDNTQLLLRCFGLANMRAGVLCQIADALKSQGKFEESCRRLTEVESTEHDMFHEAHYFSAAALSKLEMFMLSQRGNQRLQMFSDGVFSMPWCVGPQSSLSLSMAVSAAPAAESDKNPWSAASASVTTTGAVSDAPASAKMRGSNKSVAPAARAAKALSTLERSLSQLERLLDASVAHADKFGSVRPCKDSALAWTLFHAVKCVLMPSSAVQSDALDIVARLEHIKGVTVRRQARTLLYSKQFTQKCVPQIDESSIVSEESTLTDEAGLSGADGKHMLDVSRAASDVAAATTPEAKTPTEVMKKLLGILPDNLVVCSLSFDVKRQDLYLSRLESGGRHVLFKLPLKRQATREGETDGLGFEDVDEAFREIMEQSCQTISEAKDSGMNRDAALRWRQERAKLDSRLRDLLQQMETSWFGGFKGLLSLLDLDDERLMPSLVLFKRRIEAAAFRAVSKLAAMRAKPLSVSMDLCKAILRMGTEPADDKEIEDVLYYLLDAYQHHGVSIEHDEANVDAITEDIKAAINAFHTDLQSIPRGVLSVATQGVDGSTGSRKRGQPKHLVLILDKHSQHLPWESMPILRGQSVSRLPSCVMLLSRLTQQQASPVIMDRSSLFYVLNPSGDLDRTQKAFESTLKSESSWSGIIGRPPTESEIINAIQTNQIFMYFGHGGAEQYVRSQAIQELDRCAVTMLFGCSSGYLAPAGEYEPQGTALSYLLGNCPALVANLWDVTDRDIDRFSKSMLSRLDLFGTKHDGKPYHGGDRHRSLTEAVARSRDDTMLKYLIGAAPVVYGLPVFF